MLFLVVHLSQKCLTERPLAKICNGKLLNQTFDSFINYFHDTVDSTYQLLCIEFIDIIYTYFTYN